MLSMKVQAPTEVNNDKKMTELIPFGKFLETSPPSTEIAVCNITTTKYSRGLSKEVVSTPDIELFCVNVKCNGNRVFRSHMEPDGLSKKYKNLYLLYACSNCRKSQKTYSLALKLESNNSKNGVAYKFGEFPPFGPRTPSKLMSLVGPERTVFLKGRSCESQGLGIGAFAYYRRIVENQKNRILDQIIRVAEKLSAGDETIDALKAAKRAKQFARSVELVKKAIPQALLINSQNPLTLLHTALSVGLHAKSDESCLEAAQDIRMVLAGLADRLSQALKDEAELNEAVKRLTSQKSTM